MHLRFMRTSMDCARRTAGALRQLQALALERRRTVEGAATARRRHPGPKGGEAMTDEQKSNLDDADAFAKAIEKAKAEFERNQELRRRTKPADMPARFKHAEDKDGGE
jgi:uncharacterized protein YaiL (DUF2058 family)